MIEKAMEMIEEVGFERAMLLLYEAAMRAERKEYQEKHPEDSSNGYYRRSKSSRDEKSGLYTLFHCPCS